MGRRLRFAINSQKFRDNAVFGDIFLPKQSLDYLVSLRYDLSYRNTSQYIDIDSVVYLNRFLEANSQIE